MQRTAKKLVALFMIVTCLLFLGIFVLLVSKDVQAARAADQAMFQNQFTSLSYQVATTGIADKKEWEDSSAILRLQDENGVTIWQTKGIFSQVPTLLWDEFEMQVQQIAMGSQGETPLVSHKGILSVQVEGEEPYIGSQALIRGAEGETKTLDMLLPQTSVGKVLQQNALIYLLLAVAVFIVLGITSYCLVMQALKPAQRSLQSQKNFIAAASHELKAPLSVIQINNAEAKNMVSNIPQAERLLTISLAEGRRMSQLVSDMLTLASSDAGYWTMNKSEMNIETLLLQSYEKHIPAAKKKEARIQIEMPDEVFPQLKGDEERIGQVLDILLDNAIRYSPAGEVVSLQAKPLGRHLLLSVVDHGSGVPDEIKPFVFDRFFQGDASRTQRDNFGLGLSIAKEIMTQHKGKIEVQDTVGGGATFTLWL